MTPTSRRRPQGVGAVTSEWRIWGLVVVFLSLVVIFNLLVNRTVAAGLGQSTPLREDVGQYFWIWVSRVMTVPIAWWFASMVRTSERSLVHAFGTHVLGMTTAIILHTALMFPDMAAAGEVAAVPVAATGFAHWFQAVPWAGLDQVKQYIWIDVYAYWAIIGVYYAFHYHSEMLSGERKAAALEASLTRARLHALRSQLNPHFLFNTLNSISVLAHRGDRDVVSQMVEQLSSLLRRALDDEGPDTIPLDDELGFVDSYLGLQQMRYSDRLTVQTAIAPETVRALVPSMVLQPIVENAIEHGVARCVGASTVVIRASRRDDRLVLQVSDSGPGFAAPDHEPRRKGIGLRNTEARLEEMYGHDQHVAYGPTPGGGATVTIEIPFREAPAAATSRVA
ncbi:MAG: hypothetical protein FJW23_15815 [Acidimicrobiia bacterium]|nr:hypothetical protein [Acidimicrobiia bacterium]